MKVFTDAPGVSLADGRNPKLAEIWRKALEEFRSGNNTGGENSFREESPTHIKCRQAKNNHNVPLPTFYGWALSIFAHGFHFILP